VLHTHLHADHVGWNTRKVDGRWVPTFPNARYLFSGRERAYLAALSASDGSDAAIRAEVKLGRMTHPPLPGVYEDSVLPVIDAGLAREIVVDGTEVVEGFSFLPSPGHSIDHACIRFSSRGEHALFWGDVMHHPISPSPPPVASPARVTGSPGISLEPGADQDRCARRLQGTRLFPRALSGQRNTWFVADGVPGDRE
jgi:glyoxylase-like metal-dependent hydrolase (beta-lactamase superfamily II)